MKTSYLILDESNCYAIYIKPKSTVQASLTPLHALRPVRRGGWNTRSGATKVLPNTTIQSCSRSPHCSLSFSRPLDFQPRAVRHFLSMLRTYALNSSLLSSTMSKQPTMKPRSRTSLGCAICKAARSSAALIGPTGAVLTYFVTGISTSNRCQSS